MNTIADYLESRKEEIVSLYNEAGVSAKDVAKIYNCSDRYVRIILRKWGIKLKSKKEACKKYKTNDNFFNTIDTEEKAYFLGFLYADGYNENCKGIVRMNLHSKDKHILETFTKYTQPLKKLYYFKKKDQYAIHIVSRKMSDDLVVLGCPQAKTRILTFPTEEQVPNHLMRHFIRGYFDGDGCIHITKKNKPCIIFLGTQNMIEGINNFIGNSCGVQYLNIKTNKKKNIILYRITYCSKHSFIKLKDFFYTDASVFLYRKRDKFFNYQP